MEETRRLLGLPFPLGLALLAVVGVLVILLIVNFGSLLQAGENTLNFIFNPDDRVQAEIIDCYDSSGCALVYPFIYSGILLAIVITGFAYTTLLERKLVAYFQNRVGPNRVGPGGFLQPLADGIKLIFKEDIMPAQANRWVYLIAPVLKVVPTLVVLAVIPFGPPILVPWFGDVWYRVPLSLVDLNVGILWLVAIISLGTYGVVLAGWASSNKYSMMGGIRASAQMVSYELSMALTLIVPVMIAGSLSLVDITEAQGGLFINWFVFQNPLAAAILTLALIAEVNRAPFDLPEAEQELTAGYMTEYSGMKFAMFMMAEYLGMIAVSLIAAVTFFGGYQDGFGLVDSLPILAPFVLIGKTILLLAGFVWLRATLPRIRYDRLMSFGWKVMLPLALLAVVWTMVAVVIGEEFGQTAYLAFSGVMVLVALMIAGYMSTRSDDAQDDYYDIETDPAITGEGRGVVHALVNLVGGLLAIPFALWPYLWTPLRFIGQVIGGTWNFIFNINDGRVRGRVALADFFDRLAGNSPGGDEAPKSAK